MFILIVNIFSNNLVVCTTASAAGLSSPGAVSCISSEREGRGHQGSSGGWDNSAVTPDTSHVFKVSTNIVKLRIYIIGIVKLGPSSMFSSISNC